MAFGFSLPTTDEKDADLPLLPLGMTRSEPLLRRSVMDSVTGNPVLSADALAAAPDPNEVVQRGTLLPLGVTRAGDTVLASQAPVHALGTFARGAVSSLPDAIPEAISAAQYPGRVWRGEKSVFGPDGHVSDEALAAANGLAGLAMTGSMPFKAPAGALRSFGGGESLDDLLASMQSAFDKPKPVAAEPSVPFRVDPAAKSWDLYHGSTAGPDFQRFDPNFGKTAGHSEAGTLFLTPDPDAASFYAGGKGAGAEAGPRVFRTTVDPGKTKVFDLGDMIENDPTLGDRARAAVLGERSGATSAEGVARVDALRNAYRDDLLASRARDREVNAQLAEMGLPPAPLSGASYGHGYQGAVIQMAKEMGLDTAVLRGLAEHGGADQVVALTPGRVRSYYDPSQVLYSGGPTGAAVSLPFLGRDR